MCYHCATNPSIHHHCHHIAAVSLPLSHRSVAFIITLLWFHCCHCGVTFVFVMVSLLPSQCCLHVGRHFIVAIAVSPSCQSQFRCCHRSVTFVVALSQCHHRSCIIVVPLLSHHRSFIVAVAVLPSSSHCCHFVIAVVVSPSHLSLFRHHRHSVAFASVAVLSSLSRCCLHVSHGFIVAVAVLPSCQLWFRHRHHGVAFIVASL